MISIERFYRIVLEKIIPVSTEPVFVEEMQPAALSRFDYDLDRLVRERVMRQTRMKGVCNVAGRATEFVVSSDNLRETLISTASSSINRHRQLICALSMELFGHPNSSLAVMVKHINRNKQPFYIAEANSVLSNFLQRNLRSNLLICSEYFGSHYQSGQVINGILHEDLQHTSFSDDTFDIIITSEVLEHVPNAITAERELMRILKPGGVYCFTVPFLPAAEHDQVLAELDGHGRIRYFAEPQYHEDPLKPNQGILVYRLFSYYDLKKRFEEIGHKFKSYRFWSKSLGILGDDCWAFAVRKSPQRNQ